MLPGSSGSNIFLLFLFSINVVGKYVLQWGTLYGVYLTWTQWFVVHILRKRKTSFSSSAFVLSSHFVSDSYYQPENVVSSFRNKRAPLFWPDPSLSQINLLWGQGEADSPTHVKRWGLISSVTYLNIYFFNHL